MNTQSTLHDKQIGGPSALSVNLQNNLSMGSHRMFSENIIHSSMFLKMPAESQNLYFHLALAADDDGVAEAYKIIKMTGASSDAYSILLMKRFIVELNAEQVVFIQDWHEHNTIRADRIVPSIYRNLLISVLPNVQVIEPKERCDVKDNSRRLGGRSTVGLSEVKLSKDKLNTIPSFFDVLGNEVTQEKETVVSWEITSVSDMKEVRKQRYSEDFETFWKKYPPTRKAGKTIPYEKWQKLTQEQRELVLADMDVRPIHHTPWKKENGAYVPAPEVYLNKKKEYWLQPIIQEQKQIAVRGVH